MWLACLLATFIALSRKLTPNAKVIESLANPKVLVVIVHLITLSHKISFYALVGLSSSMTSCIYAHM